MAVIERNLDAFLGLFAEIANRDLFSKSEFDLPEAAEINRISEQFSGKIVVFFGVSFEHVRHAKLLSEYTDLYPVLVHSINDAIARHYAKAFPTAISVSDSGRSLFEAVLALKPIAVTTTFPSQPLFYRLALPLLSAIKQIRSVPFAYEVDPPDPIINSEWFRLHRFALANSSASYSWHRPESRFCNMTWIEPTCIFNTFSGLRRKPYSLVYAGSMTPGTPEFAVLDLARKAAERGMTVVLYDAKSAVSRSLQYENGDIEVRARQPEFDLLETLAEFEFGLLAPYLANEALPAAGSELDWLDKNGLPGKLSLYLEAGIIPLVNRRSAYVAEFLEYYGIGLVMEDDDFLNLADYLARVDSEAIRRRIDAFRTDVARQANTASLIAAAFLG
ncbi:hypothetical protein [Methylomonas albis]|uniref:Glycosyltransferase n=1 Tax=Methylomonas albis TaxID=1854563 RepID=A0ABR9CYK1_9GAMM|nr:hypothetical protein [Methylomonas albis]MBD9355059.1 hypothetical protein [Methylomonas albis]